MSHTPGPWRIVDDDPKDGAYWIAGDVPSSGDIPDGGGVIICGRGGWSNRAEMSMANARLIAAAPDLLEALKELRIDANRLCDRQLGGTYEDDCRRSIAKADAALAKAGAGGEGEGRNG